MDIIAGFADSYDNTTCFSTATAPAPTDNIESSIVYPSASTAEILTGPDVSALQLLSNSLKSVFDSPENFYSDAKLILSDGRGVSFHRCVLAARSPFFKTALASSAAVKLEMKEIAKDYEVGFDSVVVVLGYVYSGKVKPPPKGVSECADENCCHVACRPAVDFMVEVLYLAFVFQIPELVALYQRHLLDVIDKVFIEDTLVILKLANICGKSSSKLFNRCREIIVKSDVDIVTLEKSLPQHIVKEILEIRKELGFVSQEVEKHFSNIHKALDAGDIALVDMLLKEGHTNLDDAYALHYAFAYCNVKTATDLLDLELADVNRKNLRGYTVLHVAAMRKEPTLVGSLLIKGANASEMTSLDGGGGRTALLIAKQVTKAAEYNNDKEPCKGRLCVQMLEEAEIKRDPVPRDVSPSLAIAADDLRMTLLDLENRVALAQRLFPEEAQVAMEIAQMKGTCEFIMTTSLEPNRVTTGVKRTSSELKITTTPFKFLEEHESRLKALSKTVELGKRFFPRCSRVLDEIMDCENLTCGDGDNPDKRLQKKQRYMEIQEIVMMKASSANKKEFGNSTLSAFTSFTSKSKGANASGMTSLDGGGGRTALLIAKPVTEAAEYNNDSEKCKGRLSVEMLEQGDETDPFARDVSPSLAITADDLRMTLLDLGNRGVSDCADENCCHVACRPAVNFMVKVLYFAFVFQMPELVTRYQRRLLDVIDKVFIEDTLIILKLANICGKSSSKLFNRCREIIVKSDVDIVTLEKSLPQHIVKEILEIRKELGFQSQEVEKHVSNIHKALDADDMELVDLLLIAKPVTEAAEYNNDSEKCKGVKPQGITSETECVLVFSCNDNLDDVEETHFIQAILKELQEREVTPLTYDLLGRENLDVEMVKRSSVGILVVSNSFSRSNQSLDNLVAIMEHWKAKDVVIIPVYFKLTHSEVRGFKGRFQAAFQQYVISTKSGNGHKWQAAMAKITSIIDRYEWTKETQDMLAEEVVRNACLKLYFKNSKNLVRVLALLNQSQPSGADIVGIWGMAGIGKTSIAREIFGILAPQYDFCYFLQDFYRMCQEKGLRQMCDDFYSNIFGEEKLTIGASDVKPSFMRDLFQQTKILLVLDDVSNAEDAEAVVGGFGWFSHGHKIIITSRRKQILVQCKVKEPYEYQTLNEFESIHLCKRYLNGESELISEIMSCSSGIPLALEVLCSSVSKQHKNNMKEHLHSLRRNPPIQIREAFQRSFDELDENEKNIFLDLACFFGGDNKDDVVRLLDACGFHTYLGICGLVEESLISLVDKRIEIPIPFQDIGRFIVHEEDKDPCERSRLWDSNDIADVLTKNSGTEVLEGIFMDASELTCELKLSPTVFCMMYRLRLLKFYCCTSRDQCKISLPQGLDNFPDELRLLHWEKYPLKYLPQKFNPENLIELNMPYSSMEKLWDGEKNLEKLKKIKLSHSTSLTDIMVLSEALNLEDIDLEGCTSLVDISTSIPHCRKLVSLNLKDCSHLGSLPAMFDLTSLQLLNMSGCSELEEIQDFAPNLKELYLAGTAIRELPLSIENLTELCILDLENCIKLQQLPSRIKYSRSIVELKLSGCISLELGGKKRKGEFGGAVEPGMSSNWK